MGFIGRWLAGLLTPIPSIAKALPDGEEVLFEADAYYPIAGSFSSEHDVLVVVTSSHLFIGFDPRKVAQSEIKIKIPVGEIEHATLKRLRGFQKLSSGGFSEVVVVATKDGRSRELFFHQSGSAQSFCQLINERLDSLLNQTDSDKAT